MPANGRWDLIRHLKVNGGGSSSSSSSKALFCTVFVFQGVIL